jgi:hypothetical protein
MKITEIITEASLGTQAQFRRITMPRIDPVDTSAPWVQKAINQRQEITRNLTGAESDKEKLDYLWKSGISPNSFRVLNGDDKAVLSITKYFRKTGEIELSRKIHVNTVPMTVTYTGNVENNIKYLGKHRKAAMGGTVYTFEIRGLTKGKPEKIVPVDTSPKSAVIKDPWGRTK